MHPTPIQHLEMLTSHLPELEIPQKTISYVKDIDYKYVNSIKFDFKKSAPKERL
jgi:hypothetical protein